MQEEERNEVEPLQAACGNLPLFPLPLPPLIRTGRDVAAKENKVGFQHATAALAVGNGKLVVEVFWQVNVAVRAHNRLHGRRAQV